MHPPHPSPLSRRAPGTGLLLAAPASLAAASPSTGARP